MKLIYITTRILMSPFMLSIFLIISLILWIMYSLDYFIYGGEFIIYDKFKNRKTIEKHYLKMIEQVDNE